jgi:hypothetical protein
MTGTSMAVPQVTGIFATFVGWTKQKADQSKMCIRYAWNSIEGIVDNLPADTINRFANTVIKYPDNE